MMYEIRDDVFNWLICFLIKHCHCYASTFYEFCKRYYVGEIKVITESYLNFMNKTIDNKAFL